MRHRSNLERYRSNLMRHRSNLERYRSNLMRHRSDLMRHRTNLMRYRTNLMRHRTNLMRYRTNLMRYRTNLMRHRTNLMRYRINLMRHRINLMRHRSNLMRFRSCGGSLRFRRDQPTTDNQQRGADAVMTAGSRVRHHPHHPHHRGAAGSVSGVLDRRPRGAVFRHPPEEAEDSGARPGADVEDAARGAASVAAAPRSGWPRRVLLIYHRDDGGDGVPSALLLLPVMPVAAAAASAAEEDAVAADRRAAAVADGHRGLARAAVVAAWHRAVEDVRRHPRDARPSCPSAARTPAASAACTCGSVRPDGTASRRNRSTGSVSNLRDRFSGRSCKGCFWGAALSGGAHCTLPNRGPQGASGRCRAPQNTADADRIGRGLQSLRLLGRCPRRGSAAIAIDAGRSA